MQAIHLRARTAGLIGIVAAAILLWVPGTQAAPATPDEAQRAGRAPASFPQAKEDYFHDMDNAVALSPEEIQGRNMWLLWTGGNDRFWDKVTRDSHRRHSTAEAHHLAPEPGLLRRTALRPQLALALARCAERTLLRETHPSRSEPVRSLARVRAARIVPRPSRSEAKPIPGVKIGARGATFKDGSKLPVGSYFGYATGVLGLRLFPDPELRPGRKGQMGPGAILYGPSKVAKSRSPLWRRFGMACGFSMSGPSPVDPPADQAALAMGQSKFDRR